MKIFSLIATTFLIVFLSVSSALAHDPLILLPEQQTPEEGPLLPNGTISFALYGSLLAVSYTHLTLPTKRIV